MKKEYSTKRFLGQVAEAESKEITEKLQELKLDYVDHTPDEWATVGAYKMGKAQVKFYLCEERIDNDKAFEKILYLFKDEKLQNKLTSLRSFGYTAKVIKEI